MKYCTRCGSEYQEGVEECADCPGNPRLVSAEEMRSRGLPLPHELDKRVFVRAGTAEDPLTVEAFVELLEDADIPVFVRAGRSGVVDKLTTGNLLPWWEILVPEEHQARAARLLEQERVREDATYDEAAQAAEEEEQENEAPAPVPAPPPPPAV
ncbi:DUF2007 domain-containing protein [Myxococcus sp. K15C18031901]|uniref:putative signal transducing protein n=1 Tax=Myxococcus dinghuensis TaxID=2906761 RepID=UPI0020A7EF97|nr:DUF2007 domain-containing protein [Myxococcus dinghuensis]MCP3098631.1 DUF2007 domain-containing protein [Myxococcus dinghuensis]